MQQLPLECGPVRLSELAAVTALEQSAFEPPVYPTFFFRQAYDLWPNLFWVARAEQGVLGYLIAAPAAATSQELSLLSLAISPLAQGQGVGKALLQQFLRSLTAGQQIWLTVDPANTAALRLYQQFDFHVVRQEQAYYGEGYHRLVLLKQC
jgi:ribosomal protein S18 acetylase RimI-like enzyme